jgi:iron complex outermembrane receptor protein
MKNVFFTLIICCLAIFANAQFEVTGTVFDYNGNIPLPGATVQIENSNYGTSTDLNGNFKFRLPVGSYKLIVTFVGYKKAEKNFSVLDKNETIEIHLLPDMIEMTSIEILSTRANTNSPMAISEIEKIEIGKVNLGADLPYLLDQTPSVVVNSDAGNGIGYTGMRIRGSDQTRVNVTVNGIPVNDAESQGVFWVDFPDLASSVNSIQIQRGLGTSSNGAGAFGGTVNIQTLNENEKASASLSNSYGSFNSRKHTLQIGTGKLARKRTDQHSSFFTFDTRLSWIASDGYIDRATSDLKSFYIAGAYHHQKHSLRLIAFSGKEKTYQAWYGVPKDSLETNRTYNPYTYKNETDNYIQSNYQLLYNFNPNKKWKGNISFHYTKGAGYYEQFKSADDIYGEGMLNYYGINDVIIGTDTITSSDIIRQRWLDNDYYGAVYSLNFSPNKRLDILFGGGWNEYKGRHFGEVIWAQFFSNAEINHRYYDDQAVKNDFNNFIKMNYWINEKINAYADLQIRNVKYNFNGFDGDLNFVNQTINYLFLNPKAGITAYLPKNQIVYASAAVGNKEPNRDDFTNSSPSSRPKHEQLTDLEAGYKISSLKFSASVNIYNMMYKNQLVLTGKINDVGAYTRQNIAESYRRGIEIEGGFKRKQVTIAANATFSQNKMNKYIEYIDNWDTWGQDSVIYDKTDISFSPSVIAGGKIEYTFSTANSPLFFYVYKEQHKQELAFALLPKYVGKQFIDNTSSADRMLDGYFVMDARISWNFINIRKENYINMNFMLRNMLNNLYSANAWTYRYSTGGQNFTDYGFFPQAGMNYMIGLTLGF